MPGCDSSSASCCPAPAARWCPASNGATALRLARIHACGLILLAPALPELSGPQLLHALHAELTTRATPVVVVGKADWLHACDCPPGNVMVEYPCASASS